MNHSIRSADQLTHIKIVVMSLVVAIVVVAIGISARNAGINGDAQAAIKAGKPVNFSTKDVPAVR